MSLPEPDPRPCVRCGKIFTPRRKTANLNQRFCSRDCQRKQHTDDRQAQAKRAQKPRPSARGVKPKGYAKRGQRHEHRALAEQKLGRALAPGEVVHHIDGNSLNNDPSNLAVLPSQADHARLHARKS